MRDFMCPNCGQRLAFENSQCLACGSYLGFNVADRALVILGSDDAPGSVDATQYRHCGNQYIARCNWLIPPDDSNQLCFSCRLTRTRPSDWANPDELAVFADAEDAKRRIVFELIELGLPIVGRDQDPQFGLAFDLLSSREQQVMTGHMNGIVTLDLAEGDNVHREQLRIAMAEPYRTLLGHFRHEIGHYFFTVLVGPDSRARFEELFGDPDLDYQEALDRHYSEGAPEGWPSSFVSSYATMHPAEDWAETFAHYLHIRDTLDTAAAFGFAPAGAALDRQPMGQAGFDKMIEEWLPLSWALNMVNRSMGHDDLYPFVLPPAVLDKMSFVHSVVSNDSGPAR